MSAGGDEIGQKRAVLGGTLDEVVGGDEIVQVDHSRDGRRMCVVVLRPDGPMGREESLICELDGNAWVVVKRRFARS